VEQRFVLEARSLLFATISVPSKKILHRADVGFGVHAIAQLCRRTTSEAFQALKWLCVIYTILNLECCIAASALE